MKKIAVLLGVLSVVLPATRADVLGTWTFNTGTTTAERLASGNLAPGVSSLSALVFNDTFEDFGPGVIPNSDNDGLGFGGNSGEQVAFVHRAASGISPTAFGNSEKVGTTISSAPISFAVTAGAQPLKIDSLTIDITGGTAIFAVWSQVAGGLAGTVVNFAAGASATKTVYFPYAVIVEAGQSKNFTINLNSSAFNSAHYINEIQLNGLVGVAVTTNTLVASDDLALTTTWDSGTSPTNANVDTWVVVDGTALWRDGDVVYGTMRFDEGSFLRNRNHTAGQPSVEFANVVFNGGDIIYADNTQIGLLVFDSLAFDADTAVCNLPIAGTRHALRFGSRITADTPTRGIVTGSAVVRFSNYSPTDTFTPGIYDGDWSAFTGTLRVSSYNGATTLQIREWITDLSKASIVVDDLPNVKLQPKGALTVRDLQLGADTLAVGTYDSINDFTAAQLAFLDWTEGISSITVLGLPVTPFVAIADPADLIINGDFLEYTTDDPGYSGGWNVADSHGVFWAYTNQYTDVTGWDFYYSDPNGLVAETGPGGQLELTDKVGTTYSSAGRIALGSSYNYRNGMTQTNILDGLTIKAGASYRFEIDVKQNSTKDNSLNTFTAALTGGTTNTLVQVSPTTSLPLHTDPSAPQTTIVSGADLLAAQGSGPVNMIFESLNTDTITGWPDAVIDPLDPDEMSQTFVYNVSLALDIPAGDVTKDGVVDNDDVDLAQLYLDGNGGESAADRQATLIGLGYTPTEALEFLNLTDFDVDGDFDFDSADVAEIGAAFPLILQFTTGGSGFDFEWRSLSGKQYDLEAATSLVSPDWAGYMDYTNIAPSGTGLNTLNGVGLDGPVRFFRVIEK